MDERILHHFRRLLKTQVRKQKMERHKAYFYSQGADLWKLDTRTRRCGELTQQQGEEQQVGEPFKQDEEGRLEAKVGCLPEQRWPEEVCECQPEEEQRRKGELHELQEQGGGVASRRNERQKTLSERSTSSRLGQGRGWNAKMVPVQSYVAF